jgi:hypothetical protein
VIFTRIRQDLKFVRLASPDIAGISFNDSEVETQTREDRLVGVVHQIVVDQCTLFVRVERVRIFHYEFAAAHQTKTWTNFIAIFRLDLIETCRQIAIRFDVVSNIIGDDLFVGGTQTEIVTVSIFKLEKAVAHLFPSICFLPEFGRLYHRHQNLLGAALVQLFANNALKLANRAEGKIAIRVQARADLFDHPGTRHQLVAWNFGVVRSIFESEQVGF